MQNSVLIANGLESYYTNEIITLNESKIIVLGEGDAGKTSFIKTLFNEKIDNNEVYTHGIQLSILENKHFWDFGGQEIYHAMHTLFMRDKGMFIIILNGRSDEKPDRWLNYINMFAEKNAPILIVVNKIDNNKYANINEEYYRFKKETIKNIFYYSSKNTDVLSKEGILKEIDDIINSGFFTGTYPKKYLEVKKAIEEVHKDYILDIEWQEICEKLNIGIEDEKNYLRFLEYIGLLYSCGEILFLNFNKLLKHVYSILELDNTEFKESGLISESEYEKHIIQVIKTEYSSDTRVLYKSIYKFISNDKTLLCRETEIDEQKYLFFPYVLRKRQSNSYDKVHGLTRMCFRYNYLPTYIFRKLIVIVYDYIEKSHLWYFGFACTFKDNIYYVYEEENDIAIYINGKEIENIDFIIFLAKCLRKIQEDSNIKELFTLDFNITDDIEYRRIVEILKGDRFMYNKITNNFNGNSNIDFSTNKNNSPTMVGDGNVQNNSVVNETKGSFISELKEIMDKANNNKCTLSQQEEQEVNEVILAIERNETEKVKKFLSNMPDKIKMFAFGVGQNIIANCITNPDYIDLVIKSIASI